MSRGTDSAGHTNEWQHRVHLLAAMSECKLAAVDYFFRDACHVQVHRACGHGVRID